MDVTIEGPAVYIVLADEPGFIGLRDRCFEPLALQNIFAADIDVAGMRLHCEGGDETALDQEMRIVAHDLPVLAGPGLRFIGIDDEVVRPRRIGGLRHERPFEARREAGAAAPAQARSLHFGDDPILTFVDEPLSIVPGTAFAGAFKVPVAEAVEISEDAVLIGEHFQILRRMFAWRRTRLRGTIGALAFALNRPLGAGAGFGDRIRWLAFALFAITRNLLMCRRIETRLRILRRLFLRCRCGGV